MKTNLLCLLALVTAIGLFVGLTTLPVKAATTNYHLEMWIAPLECTRNEVSDGVTTNVILTPQECNEFLYPINGNPGGSVSVPRAPDTGVFRDKWTTAMTVLVFTAFASSIIALVIRDLRAKRLKIGRH